MRDGGFGEFVSAHFRAVALSLAAIVVICVAALIALPFLSMKSKLTSLEISVAPFFATVEIDGNTYNNGVYEFAPGEYSVKISADGFISKEAKISIADKENAKFADYIVHKDEGLAYFERSEADLRTLEAIDDSDVKSFLANYNRKIGIKDILPIDASYDMSEVLRIPGNELYEQKVIDGSRDPRCKKAFCLLVTGYKLNEAKIREKLRDLGYNLSDYEVIYDF